MIATFSFTLTLFSSSVSLDMMRVKQKRKEELKLRANEHKKEIETHLLNFFFVIFFDLKIEICVALEEKFFAFFYKTTTKNGEI